MYDLAILTLSALFCLFAFFSVKWLSQYNNIVVQILTIMIAILGIFSLLLMMINVAFLFLPN